MSQSNDPQQANRGYGSQYNIISIHMCVFLCQWIRWQGRKFQRERERESAETCDRREARERERICCGSAALSLSPSKCLILLFSIVGESEENAFLL